MRLADAVVVGAGIAGVSVAYELSVRHGLARVVIADPRPPLTLTSDKSTECYRNWWPNRPMVELMNRSIDLLEEMDAGSDHRFGLNRRGYLFVTADPARLAAMTRQARLTEGFGAGPVRAPCGVVDNEAPDGVDILDPDALAGHFPFLTKDAVGALHVRRAGWFSAQQLGSWMLERARDQGAELVTTRVTGFETSGGRLTGVSHEGDGTIGTDTVVVAAGPLTQEVTAEVGVELPLHSELHLKTAFRDHMRVIPREAPMIIWCDTQQIDWSREERAELESMGRADLLGEMPVFCHGRPEGGPGSPYVLALWEYDKEVVTPTWPIPVDPLYTEVVMRGLTRMVPGLAVYRERLPESVVDGGYYTKTPENRPLIGPVGPEGFHVVAGLSGFGVMVAPGAADLVAAHVTGDDLPEYAGDFLPARHLIPGYAEEVAAAEEGQL